MYFLWAKTMELWGNIKTCTFYASQLLAKCDYKVWWLMTEVCFQYFNGQPILMFVCLNVFGLPLPLKHVRDTATRSGSKALPIWIQRNQIVIYWCQIKVDLVQWSLWSVLSKINCIHSHTIIWNEWPVQWVYQRKSFVYLNLIKLAHYVWLLNVFLFVCCECSIKYL